MRMAVHIFRINFNPLMKHNYTNFPTPPHHLVFSFHCLSTLKKESRKSIGDHLIKHYQFSTETVSKASSALSRLKCFEQVDVTIEFLKDFGFSHDHLEEVIRRMPRILSAKLDTTIKPKIQFLEHLGISPADIADLISRDPWILHRDRENQLGPSMQALRSFLGSDAEVMKFLKLRGGFLKYNLQKTMVPNIQLMESCGISQPQITQCLFSFPRLFLYKPEKIKSYIERVDKMGVDRNSKMFIHAIRIMSSMSEKTWESKWQLFRSLGFAEEDILSLFRRSPQVFGASEKKIKETSELLSSGEFDSTILLDYPEIVLFSIKQRIVPRFKVLDVLEANNLVKRRPSLRTLCKLSDSQFLSKYVDPYVDLVGELYLTCQGS